MSPKKLPGTTTEQQLKRRALPTTEKKKKKKNSFPPHETAILPAPAPDNESLNQEEETLVQSLIERVRKSENPLLDLFKLVPYNSDYYDAVLSYDEEGDADCIVALPDLIMKLMKVIKLTPAQLNATYQDGGGGEIGTPLGMVVVYKPSARVDTEEFIVKLIQSGADAKQKATYREGAAQPYLHALLEHHDITYKKKARIAKVLVDNGADVNETDGYKSLVQRCIDYHDTETLQVLLEAFDTGGYGITDKDNAVSYIVKKFLMSPDRHTNDTVVTMVKLFVDAGCDIKKVIDDNGNTVFHGLVKWNRVEDSAPVYCYNPRDGSYMNCIDALADYFIDAGLALRQNDSGQTVLHLTAKDKFLNSIVKKLIINCPSLIKMKDNEGKTALTVAIDNGTSQNIFSLLRPISLTPENW